MCFYNMSTGLEQVMQTDDWDRVTVHDNGRITIPKDLRDEYGIEDGDPLIVGENAQGDLCILKPGN